MERARQAYAGLARAVAQFEPVTMIARPQDARAAQTMCGDGVTLSAHEIDDSWIRDSGPSFVRDGQGGLAGVIWHFNGWGGRYAPHDRDARIASEILNDLSLTGHPAALVAEGGALHVDGVGTLLTTEQCLLNPNRNPGMTRDKVEAILKKMLGVGRVIWLAQGLSGDETDGHIDNVACFAAPGQVILQGCADISDANFAIVNENRRRLLMARDAGGGVLEVVELPAPRARLDASGKRLTLSYVNFYLTNGGLILPSFEDPADAAARQILAEAFPGRRIVQYPALDIVQGGGGIHCVTQQMPAA